MPRRQRNVVVVAVVKPERHLPLGEVADHNIFKPHVPLTAGMQLQRDGAVVQSSLSDR